MTRIGALVVLALLLGTGGVTAQQQPRKEVIANPGPSSGVPISAGIRSGRFVFFSGVLGRNAAREIVPGGTAAETRQVLENLRATARVAGLDLVDMIKCTVFIVDFRDFDAMNKVYAEFFPSEPPARSTVGVTSLAAGAKVEIECIGAVR